MHMVAIHCQAPDATVAYAADELARCLNLLPGICARVNPANAATADSEYHLRLGLFADMGLEPLQTAPADQDALAIEIGAAGGVLAGSNPRSVLFAVYRYLDTVGFRWVRPGPTGEHVPSSGWPLPSLTLRDQASYRHRGICIEGAVSRENVLDMIDWMPKLGFNGYFIQFREAYNFFQRWYEHTGNPTLEPEPFSMDRARELTALMRGEIKKRGLDLHMTGHGWTCEPFGIPGPGWFVHEGDIPEAARQHLALVKGTRDLWGGIALNTNLCYGNPETRTIVNDAIVAWAAENTDVDIIHVWLADGSNNQCECPLCADSRPADLYVRLLNELDRKLTAAGSSVRIVFLVYVDLLWPPEKEALENQDRFILMFAPITRSYSTPFAVAAQEPSSLPPYERNKLSFPREPAANLAFLSAWQTMFQGDSFDFDYHFMWDHHRDAGQTSLPRVLHQDCARLRDMGLNGMVSCQNQRVFFPNGLGMDVMGRTLWNRGTDFDDLARDYFSAAYGKEGPRVRAYLEAVSLLVNPRLLRQEGTPTEMKQAARQLAGMSDLVAGMREAIHAGKLLPSAARAESWRILGVHADFLLQFAPALIALYDGDTAAARLAATQLFRWCQTRETELQAAFDLYEFQVTLGGSFGISPDDLQ